MRNVAASLFLSLAAGAERPDELVTDVDDATEANLRASHDDHRHHRL
jgi:hypothetical protein